MKIDKALIHLKENDLKANNEYMIGVMYQNEDEFEDDLFSLIKITYEKNDECDWWVAHLTESYLPNYKGDRATSQQFMASGENINELLDELHIEIGKHCFDLANEKIDKLLRINYKIYQLDEDIIEFEREYALSALFPELPSRLVCDKSIPSKEDITEFKDKAKEKINAVNE